MHEDEDEDEDRGLQDWMSDARISEAARRRRRLGSWRTHGPDEATFAGVLADLADRRCPVRVSFGADRHHVGIIQHTEGAWTILDIADDRRVGVRIRSILAIDCEEIAIPFGDRPCGIETGRRGAGTGLGTDRLIESLADPTGWLVLRCGALTTSGRLRWLTPDLAVMETGGGLRYLPLDAVDEVIGSTLS